MGKGSSAPAAPDYTPIASANAEAAEYSYQLGKEQQQWAKDQFNTVWPYAKDYMEQQARSSAAEADNATKAQSFFESTYQPLETKFADTAYNYGSETRANQMAGMAKADVASAYDAARASALSNLESYGIDPSQTRFGALDLGTRISQAAASAGAATQARLNAENTGLALMGEAINVGRGYPGAVANAYQTSTGAGQAGIGTANATTGMGASTMGTGGSWQGLGNQSQQQRVGALNTGFENQMAGANFQAQQSANASSGIGSIVGGALSIGAIAL